MRRDWQEWSDWILEHLDSLCTSLLSASYVLSPGTDCLLVKYSGSGEGWISCSYTEWGYVIGKVLTCPPPRFLPSCPINALYNPFRLRVGGPRVYGYMIRSLITWLQVHQMKEHLGKPDLIRWVLKKDRALSVKRVKTGEGLSVPLLA